MPSSLLKIMDSAVSSKTGRRRGVTKENILHGSLTEEQRSRRPVFDETLRAEALLSLFFVAPRFEILADISPRHFANNLKISISSSVQDFSTGC
jgi:hypothetical protein